MAQPAEDRRDPARDGRRARERAGDHPAEEADRGTGDGADAALRQAEEGTRRGGTGDFLAAGRRPGGHLARPGDRQADAAADLEQVRDERQQLAGVVAHVVERAPRHRVDQGQHAVR
ncbi:hypothetical protein [Amycolatopsis vastitatis]|uniref:Uncharacterized protein n=1 Tax=Amycolatopsis vastitatis TaxID=1905142 RepID=A0A229SNI1_9PSEU|nr:hypothetical protein [Amycolatopsis vastitatis]OXM60334.1 hypothetical protein CF165_42705 [Amycolatopsis vastitatis]